MKLSRSTIAWIIVLVSAAALATQAALYFRVQRVPVLKQDVPAGTQITPDMIGYTEVNPHMPIMKNVVKDVKELFVDGKATSGKGRYTLAPMLEGQLIDRRMIVDTLADPRFGIGVKVGEGESAITLLLSIQNALGGFVQPGQRVDLSYALKKQINLDAPFMTQPQDVQTPSVSQPIDEKTITMLRDVLVLDVRNESGAKVMQGSATTSKKLLITVSIPREKATDISVAASGGGIVYLSLPRQDGR